MLGRPLALFVCLFVCLLFGPKIQLHRVRNVCASQYSVKGRDKLSAFW